MTKIDMASSGRSPVQGRSRASTDRMLACATTLFLAGGYEAVTASAVAREADVAVGTLYGRFGNKDGLVHAVQQALLLRLQEAVTELEASPEWQAARPEDLIGTLIRSLAGLLSDHADSLQPIMRQAAFDPETARLGKVGYEHLRTAFLRASERAWPLIRHPDPEDAVESCFTIAYAALARALGLGSSPDVANVEALPKLTGDLVAMCDAYLFRT